MRRLLRSSGAAALVTTAAVAGAGIGFGGPAGASAQPTTWNFTQAAIPPAEPLGNYGRGVLVAVVDTWVDFTQPQFSGRVVDEANCTSGNCVDRQYAPDECVHGTHVAGTIASDDYGVAPEADILAVQVLSGTPGSTNDPNASCQGNADAVAAGIEFAVAKGARVINLSLADEVPGLFQSSAITSAVSDAAGHGDLVVFAAGNDDLPLTDNYGNDALIVAATGPSGQLAGYSEYNSVATGHVDVAAPGGDTGNAASCSTSDCVLSTFPHNQLGLLEGTSMAAPHVSGLAALLFAQDPGRSVANVISTIEKTATPLAGAGYGLIDAKAALAVEAGAHPPVSGPSPQSPSSSPPPTTPAHGSPTPAPISSAGGGGSGADGQGATTGARVSVGPALSVAPAPTTAPLSEGSVTTVGPRDGGSGPPAVALPSGSGRTTAAGRTGAARAGDWLGRHAAVAVVAAVLIVVDLLALAWTREVRRVFGAP